MTAELVCPSCGHRNFPGEDRCAQCFDSLMQRDLPKPKTDDPFQQTMMTDPVSALLTGKDLLVASPSDAVEKAVEVLTRKRKDCVLIYEKKKLVGILSQRDLLKKASGGGADLKAVKVSQIMTPNPETVHPEDPIAFAVNKMAMGGFRHVPVVSKQDGSPLSIISIKDVLSYLCRKGQSQGSAPSEESREFKGV